MQHNDADECGGSSSGNVGWLDGSLDPNSALEMVDNMLQEQEA